MKIFMDHNSYRHRGRAGVSFRQDAELLESHGYQVVRWPRDNKSIEEKGLTARFELAGGPSRPAVVTPRSSACSSKSNYERLMQTYGCAVQQST